MLPAMDGMAGACDPLVEVLVPCLPLLEWRAPGFGRLSPEIADKMAVCEILGPDGMFIDPDIRFGLLVQRAHLLYPPHRHAAEELYLVLQGTALWAVDGEEPRPRRPGEFVHHAPRRTHAMRTEAEQLLAAWAWTGDIGAATYSA
ncbi:MAG: dimethylsulfonioproprionate lyase family protein [Pikeienuella sp.]|uniref:dimethylsulfonioproprionate lyase family protein n=1 Tax=Pikeienuella sp. TaxID=2831957 RepID=UPI00391C9C84